jgi:tetratricopeptide (TPR) repeat protein
MKTTIIRVLLASAVAGCATGGGAKPTGPENAPAEEGGGGPAKAAAQQPKGDLAKMVAEAPKAGATDSGESEDAWQAALDKAQKMLAEPKPNCSGAADVFESFAGKNPKAASAWYNAGLAYDKCGELDKAERAYKKSLDVNSRYSNAIGGLGVVAWKRGNKQEARAKFTQALQIDQRCLPALVNMATLLRDDALRSGNSAAVTEAQDDVRRALAVDGNNMAAYTTLALLYYDLAGGDKSKLEMADTVITQAKGISEKYAPLWNASGLIALKKKNVTRALRDFRRAIELDPNFVEAHLNVGAITLSFRDYTSAEASFKAVLKQDSKNIDAVIGLGVAYRGQRKIKEAEEQYVQAAKLDPRNCAVPYDLGLLYQDYMSGQDAELRKAQTYYRDFASRCNGAAAKDKIADADRRIKNIDETFAAMIEAKKLEEEAKRIEAQQKAQEEQQKKQQEQQQKDQPQTPTPNPTPVNAPGEKKPSKK